MTTASQNVPTFPTTTHGHPAIRAVVILGLCASLLAGFLASSSKTFAPASNAAPAGNAAQSTSIACDRTSGTGPAC